MTERPDGLRCPRCGEWRWHGSARRGLIEFDRVTQRFVCVVCAATWRDSVAGEASRIAQIRTSLWPGTGRSRRDPC
jgi:hypothetical protein